MDFSPLMVSWYTPRPLPLSPLVLSPPSARGQDRETRGKVLEEDPGKVLEQARENHAAQHTESRFPSLFSNLLI